MTGGETMKRYIYAFAAMLLASACSSLGVKEPENILELEEKDFVIPAAGGEFSLGITYSEDYTVTCEEKWVREVMTKATSGTLTFRVDPNKGYDDRHARLVVSVPAGKTDYIDVTQKQKNALMLAKDNYEIGKEGGTVTVEVQANVAVSAEVDADAASWLKKVGTKGLKSTTFAFSADPSEEDSVREGKIRFSNGDLEEYVTVYQAGEPVLVLGESSFSLTTEGGIVEVDLTTNTEYDIVMPEVDWVTYKPSTRGLVTGRIRFEVDPNESHDSRQAEILVKSRKGSLEESILISQNQKDAIIAGTSLVEVGCEAGTFTLTLGSNVEYQVSVDAEWLRKMQTRAFVEEDIAFSYDANDEMDDREALITFSYEGLKQDVKVVQKGFIKDYRFYVTHYNSVFTVPTFGGFVSSGTVFWGDGAQDEYAEGLVHQYNGASVVKTEVVIKGGKGERVVSMNDLTGVLVIDLSKL